MRLHRFLHVGLAAALVYSGQASAGYTGESFLQVPGLDGGWPQGRYRDWVKFEAREWTRAPVCAARENNPQALVCDEQFWRPRASRMIFSAPWAPRDGEGQLAVALDKKSPALAGMMALCQSGEVVPELTYAESAQRSRRIGEVGPLPAGAPEYFEYTLSGVTLQCPVVADAPEQAFIFTFEDIEWNNYSETGEVVTLAEAAPITPRPSTGESRTYVLNWIAPTGAFNENECPELNEGPTEEQYLALMSAEEAAEAKQALEEMGGLSVLRAGISTRGPAQLNVCALPGTVADPGHAMPVSDVARGFNLDGYSGSGERPAGVHDHPNFVSEDGREGIDNQLYRVEGCVPGFRPGGNIPKITNQMMRNGSVTVIVDISGIDDFENDDHVSINWLYSQDMMEKTADGTDILPDYTFRITDNPEFAQFFTHFDARIENGVVIAEPLEEMTFQDGGQNAMRLYRPHLRIQFEEGEQKISATMGGYYDWRRRVDNWNRSRILENTMRFQCPAVYNAFKHAADGVPDPVTGEFNGISVAYDITGLRAFIPESQQLGMLGAKD